MLYRYVHLYLRTQNTNKMEAVIDLRLKYYVGALKDFILKLDLMEKIQGMNVNILPLSSYNIGKKFGLVMSGYAWHSCRIFSMFSPNNPVVAAKPILSLEEHYFINISAAYRGRTCDILKTQADVKYVWNQPGPVCKMVSLSPSLIPMCLGCRKPSFLLEKY